MKRLKLGLALAATALLALSGIAMAKDHGRDDRPGDDHGRHDQRDDHGHHHRHHHDRFIGQAGTVSSFDARTGKLTIALTNGDSITGMVTSATEIKCEGVDDRLQRRDHGSGGNSGSGSGDDHGGQNEPGDDNGGHGEEPGDDNGGATALPEASCSTASLVTGEIVSEAELRLEGGAAFFEEVELGLHS
jgi:hypothetical protein